jgi:1,4-dihydroxy-2-naphthoyl-CoA hydrolase
MAIWFGVPSVEFARQMNRATLAAWLHIEVTAFGDDWLRGTMPVEERTLQPAGLLHGGASLALAETLGSIGAICCVDRERYTCVGQEINANHLRAVRSGLVVGTARPFHIGARSQVWSIEIRDERERLVCVSRLTMAVLDRPAKLAR